MLKWSPTSLFRSYITQIALVCLFVCSSQAKSNAIISTDIWDKNFLSSPGQKLILEAQNATSRFEKDDVVVLLDEGSYSLDEKGRCTTRYRMVYRIQTQTGMQEWSTIEAGWAPWYQERPEFHARVVTPDGLVHLLSPETVSEAAENEGTANLFDDRRVVRAPLPALAIGSIVEQEIVIREKVPYFAGGVVRKFYFGRSVWTLKTRLVIEFPASLHIRHKRNQLPDLISTVSEQNGRNRLVFESGILEPLKLAEPGLPPDIARWSNVSFTTGKSWPSVAASYQDIVEQQISKTNISDLVKQTVGDTTKREQVISKLLAKIRKDIRYVGLEFGSASITPHSPAETLKHKYGDCKDQAALLVKMLRTLNIPAYLALIRSGVGEDVDRELPGLGNFDHAIVYVQGNPSIWIDPTEAFRPVGELPLYDQGRWALIIKDESVSLLRTPEAPSTENRQVEIREFLLSDFGRPEVHETTQMFGSIGAAFRNKL